TKPTASLRSRLSRTVFSSERTQSDHPGGAAARYWFPGSNCNLCCPSITIQLSKNLPFEIAERQQSAFDRCIKRWLLYSGMRNEADWWAWVDSNYRPHPYQGCALTT